MHHVEPAQCAWCGARSSTICGRCRTRAYCGVECQRLDWHSGHQTACCATVPDDLPEERLFEFYQVHHVAHWAVNLRQWQLEPNSQELRYLLGRIKDKEALMRITSATPFSALKRALAKELVVRRLAEVMTQAMWHKVRWKRDPMTGREFLVEREEYIWTGKKYQNANRRFPNFNFSIAEASEYLFVVSHPVALTGVYAGGPLSPALPDPRTELSVLLGQGDGSPAGPLKTGGDSHEKGSHSGVQDNCQTSAAHTGHVPLAECPGMDSDHSVAAEPEAPPKAVDEDPEEDKVMFSAQELAEMGQPEDVDERRRALRRAIVGKFAYFRTLGRMRGRCWSQVVLGQQPVGDTAGRPEFPGGKEISEEEVSSRQHPLHVGGLLQKRWRCEVHNWRGYCIVVCRAPPEEVFDPVGEFRSTQAVRFPEIDKYDDVLDHTEPQFLEIPVKQLLPEKWHSDYERACGRGERGESTRMNYSGARAPHVPCRQRPVPVPRV